MFYSLQKEAMRIQRDTAEDMLGPVSCYALKSSPWYESKGVPLQLHRQEYPQKSLRRALSWRPMINTKSSMAGVFLQIRELT